MMPSTVVALPALKSVRNFPAETELILHRTRALHRHVRHLDRLCRLGSDTGAFRPTHIRTYREDFDLGAIALPGFGHGLTTSELVAHLETVMRSIQTSLDPAYPMPGRLVAKLRRTQFDAILFLGQTIGILMTSPGAATAMNFDVDEYRLMLEYGKTPAHKLGALTGYALRLSAEINRRVERARMITTA